MLQLSLWTSSGRRSTRTLPLVWFRGFESVIKIICESQQSTRAERKGLTFNLILEGQRGRWWWSMLTIRNTQAYRFMYRLDTCHIPKYSLMVRVQNLELVEIIMYWQAVYGALLSKIFFLNFSFDHIRPGRQLNCRWLFSQRALFLRIWYMRWRQLRHGKKVVVDLWLLIVQGRLERKRNIEVLQASELPACMIC